MIDFYASISLWYRQNSRDLPWRNTKNPYKIWLSEIILQQTRVDQGLKYYLKFVKNYPTVKDLALASEEEILNDWQGLGYYSRARNLHAAAKYIYDELGGQFPNSYNEILKLKGVGTYTAAAIASFAFLEPKAVVDGNVYRVLSRVFDINTPIDSTAGKKEFQLLADQLIPMNEPDVHNQAIMEFGALQCVPANPNCNACVLVNDCLAFANNTVAYRPVKEKRTKVRDRFFYYLICKSGDSISISKRTESDIWQNMYQFPLIEKENRVEEGQFIKEIESLTKLKVTHISEERKHVLSHQRLYTRFVHVDGIPTQFLKDLIEIKDLEKYPLPRLIDRYLEEIEGY